MQLRVLTRSLCVVYLQTAAVCLAGDPFPEKDYPNVVAPVAEFGSYGTGLGEMNEPVGLAISRDNKLFIAESYNARVQVFSCDGKAVRAWRGTDKGELTCPQGIALDEGGKVYVSDQTGKIVVYDEMGNLLYSFGEQGSGIGQLKSPTSLVVRQGKVFVTDVGNSRIQVFKQTGEPLFAVGKSGEGNGTFTVPMGIDVDDDGNIYVVDMLNRVQKFDRTGAFNLSWGVYGGLAGQLAEPSDVCFHEGRIYVADRVNHRLQVFTTDGHFVLQWGRHPETHHAGRGRTHYPSTIKISQDGRYAAILEPFEYRCQVYDVQQIRGLPQVDVKAWWEKFPQFHYGGGLRIARHSRVPALRALFKDGSPIDLMVMTEPDIGKVVTFTIDAKGSLTKLYDVGSFGKGLLKWEMLSGKKPTSKGDLLIGDAGNNVIQKLNLVTHQPISTHFGPGNGPGEFQGPSGIAEAPNGDLYIGDFHNDRIQVFGSNLKYKFQFGKTGDKDGELFGPMSLEFSADNEMLYVVEQGNQRVQAFDRKGKHLFSFGGHTPPGKWGSGTFQSPFDVGVSPEGDVYVTDPALQLVERFSAKGEFKSQWGGWGTKPGQFYKCKGIDVDSAGRVYVIDFGNHRGQIFDKDGKFLAIFGEGILYPAQGSPQKIDQNTPSAAK